MDAFRILSGFFGNFPFERQITLWRERNAARVIPGDDAMAKELNDTTIRENAVAPAEVTGDSGSMKQHPLKDQIEADRYLSSKQAARSRGLGVRVTKMIPPGAG